MTSATTDSYLAGSASFSTVPATVTPTVAYERGAATQQDVEDDPQTPKITSLVIERGFISEDLHNLWSHVFSWATLRNNTIEKYIENMEQTQVKTS